MNSYYRSRNRFLFLPRRAWNNKTFRNEWRWFRRAKWLERWHSSVGMEYLPCWITIEWIDEEEK